MDRNRAEGVWKQPKGKIKQPSAKFADDDREVVNGRRGQLAGKGHERYGIAKDEADRQIDVWARGARDEWFVPRSKSPL